MKQTGVNIYNLPGVNGYKDLVVCIDYFSKRSEANRLKISLLNLCSFSCTVKPVYSGHAIKRTPGKSGHFFKEPAESRSNSHRKISK